MNTNKVKPRKIDGTKPPELSELSELLFYEDELDWIKRVYGAEKAKKLWDCCKPKLKCKGMKFGSLIFGTKK